MLHFFTVLTFYSHIGNVIKPTVSKDEVINESEFLFYYRGCLCGHPKTHNVYEKKTK